MAAKHVIKTREKKNMTIVLKDTLVSFVMCFVRRQNFIIAV